MFPMGYGKAAAMDPAFCRFVVPRKARNINPNILFET